MIVFDVDCNQQVGMGHFIRCRTLAEILCRYDDILFVTRSSITARLASKEGFNAEIITNSINEISEDLNKLIRKHKKNIHLWIIDNYSLSLDYLDTIKAVFPVMYIDDLNERAWNVDIVLNYNISSLYRRYHETYKGKKTILLIGPNYCLLKKEFVLAEPITIKKDVKSIFISTGGTDPFGISRKTVESLASSGSFEGINFIVLSGPFNTDIPKLKELEKKYNHIEVVVNAKEVSKVMRKCDMAISAAGTTLYELASLGIPTITFSIADNQDLGAYAFDKKGLMISIGRYDNKFFDRVFEAARNLKDNFILRKHMQDSMKDCINIHGAKEVCSEIIKFIDKEFK